MQANQKIIAMPAGADGAGIITWWSLSGDIKASDLQTALAGIIDPALMPRPGGASAALARAVAKRCAARQTRKHGVIAIRRSESSWWLVNKRAVDDGEDVELAAYARVEVVNDVPCEVYLRDGDYDLAEAIVAEAASASDTLAATQFSTWLSGLHHRIFNATSLRDAGGFYYVPPAKRDTHKQLWDAIMKASKHRVYTIDALPTEDTIDAVFASLERDYRTAVAAIEDVLKDADPATRSVNVSKVRAEKLAAKLDSYRSLIGSRVDVLADHLLTIQSALAVAI